MNKPLYKFTIQSSEGTYVVEANHPNEVWGEIWTSQYPPTDAEIVKVEPNSDYLISGSEDREFWDFVDKATKSE